MRFNGTTAHRTGGLTTEGHAPSESLIQKLNPQREVGILKATGWTQLATGSLNLVSVKEHVHTELLREQPVYEERGTDIKYPTASAGIPLARVSYRYYSGRVDFGSKKENVLVRIAEVPASKTIVELFSQEKLRVKLGIEVGKEKEVEVVVFHRKEK